VRSRHEFKVSERLTDSGIESFLPVAEKMRKWKDRKRLVSFPLFPGYLFVNQAAEQERIAVLKTSGVVRFIGFSPAEPEPVPEEQIISLQRLVENKADLDPYPYLKEGVRVRIRRGPLTGIEGVLVERVGSNLIVLSVDVIQQGAALKIEPSEVERV
jgi:transcription antitermination factor NusG